jgi:hypothetical protein
MEFTKLEAKRKAEDRQWLRTRNEWSEDIELPTGTWGQVVGAGDLGRIDPTTNQDIWGVHVRFPAEGVLILDVGKDRYLESFVEIVVDQE